MKKTILAVVISALTLPVFASDSENADQKYLDLCKSYAKEDGVSADEMDEYIKNCVKDFQESAAAGSN